MKKYKIFQGYRFVFVDERGYLIYDDVQERFNKFFKVKKSGMYGILDWDSYEDLIPCEYADIQYTDDGFFKVKKAGRWGFIDKQGHVVIPCVFKHENTPPDIVAYYKERYNFIAARLEKRLKTPSNDISYYCESYKTNNILFEADKSISLVINRCPLFVSDLQKCFMQLCAKEDKLTIELVLKNYGKKKEDVEPNGSITFSNATDNLTYNYTGGAVTFIPSSRQWVSTSIIRISDEDMVKILHEEKTTVTTQQGETLPVKEAYEDYLCLKYLVCPLACTDEQKAYLQNMVDKEKQEAQRKAAELEVKHQEEKRAERAVNERKLQEHNSGCASVIIILIIVIYFLF